MCRRVQWGPRSAGSAGPLNPWLPRPHPSFIRFPATWSRGWRTGTVGVVGGAHPPAPTCLSCLVFRRLALAAWCAAQGDSGGQTQLSRQDRCEGVPCSPGVSFPALKARQGLPQKDPQLPAAERGLGRAPVLPGSSSPASQRVTRVLAGFRKAGNADRLKDLLFILHRTHTVWPATGRLLLKSVSLVCSSCGDAAARSLPGHPARAQGHCGRPGRRRFGPGPCSAVLPEAPQRGQDHRPLQLGQPVAQVV